MRPRWAKGLVMLDLCLLLGGIGATVVFAETRLTAGLGVSNFIANSEDGTWWQSDQPHGFDTLSLALRAGIEQDVTSNWYVGAGYVRLGNVQAWTKATTDESFFQGHHDDRRYYVNAVDRVQGGELYMGYRWTDWPVQPFLTAGIAQFWHAVTQTNDVETHHGPVRSPDWTGHGTYRAWRMGGGLCYQWVCGEVTYYKGATPGSNYPISTDAIVPMFAVKIPLSF